MSLPVLRLSLLCCVLALLVTAVPAAAARTVTRTGTLEAVHGHRAADWGAEHALRLGRYELDARAIGGADRFAHRLGGRKVRAVGTVTRRGVLRLRRLRAVGPPPARAAHVLSGPKQVLVVPFRVAGQAATPPSLSKANIDAAVFGATGSLRSYLQESSGGDVTLTGETMDPIEVTPARSPLTNCDDFEWLDKVDVEVAKTKDLKAYDRVVYVSADLVACDFAGQAPVSNAPLGKGTWLHLNGTTSVRVAAHEWGHTYGLMHAASTRCFQGRPTAVALSTDCDDTEYGDPFDPMGTTTQGAVRWFQAFNRIELGMLGAGGTQTALQSGRYTIGALAQSTTGPRLLKVGRPDLSVLGLELRRTSGAHETFAQPHHDGVIVRVLPAPGSVLSRALTRLVDAHPSTASPDDAPLRAGETLTDPLSGVAITVVSTEADRATVDVGLPGVVAPPVPELPSLTTSTPAPAPPPATSPGVTAPPPPATTPTVTLPPRTTPTTGRRPVRGALAAKVLRRRSRSVRVRVTPGCACSVTVSLRKGKKLLAKRTRRGRGVVVLRTSRSIKGATLVVRQGRRTLRKKV